MSSFTSSCLPMAMRSVGEALELDKVGRTKEAYCQYLSCAVFILQSLKEDGWASELSSLATADTYKMFDVVEKCLGRSKDIITSLNLDKGTADDSKSQDIPPPYERKSSTTVAPTTNTKLVLPSSDPSAADSDAINKLLLSLPTPPGNQSRSGRSGSLRRSMVVAPKSQLQTQQMFDAYQRRKLLTESRSRQNATNATLEAVRRLAENNALKKAREDALCVKMKKRQERAKEAAEKRFSSQYGGHATNKEYKKHVYAKVVEFEQETAWTQSLRHKIEANSEDANLINSVVSRILRCKEHPLGALMAELQYLLYRQVAPLVKDFHCPDRQTSIDSGTGSLKSFGEVSSLAKDSLEERTSIENAEESPIETKVKQLRFSTGSHEDNNEKEPKESRLSVTSRPSLSDNFQEAYDDLEDCMLNDTSSDEDEIAEVDSINQGDETGSSGSSPVSAVDVSVGSGLQEDLKETETHPNEIDSNIEQDKLTPTVDGNQIVEEIEASPEEISCSNDDVSGIDVGHESSASENPDEENMTISCSGEDDGDKHVTVEQDKSEEIDVVESKPFDSDSSPNKLDDLPPLDDGNLEPAENIEIDSNKITVDYAKETTISPESVTGMKSGEEESIENKEEGEINLRKQDGGDTVPACPPDWLIIPSISGENSEEITLKPKDVATTDRPEPSNLRLDHTKEEPSTNREPVSSNTLSNLAEQYLMKSLNTIVKDIHEALDLLHSLLLVTFAELEDPTGRDQSYATLERLFFDPIWPWLNLVFRKVNSSKEQQLWSIISRDQEFTLKDFNVREKFWLEEDESSGVVYNPYGMAVEELQRVVMFSAPLDKLECTVRTSRIICSSIDEYWQRTKDTPAPSIGCDDLLPILTYVILKSNLPQLVSECHAMEEFIHEGYLMGEEGYCLTSMSTALAFLLSKSAMT